MRFYYCEQILPFFNISRVCKQAMNAVYKNIPKDTQKQIERVRVDARWDDINKEDGMGLTLSIFFFC
jgi:hypothetical protein